MPITSLFLMALITGTSLNSDSTPRNYYNEMKAMAYATTYDQLHMPAPGNKEIVYGVIMDWDYDGKTFITVIAFRSGDASMYFSTGGGMIGGVTNPNIRHAGIALCDTAQQLLPDGVAHDTALNPERGMIKFYLMTNKGKYIIKDALANKPPRHMPVTRLFIAANVLIEQFKAADNRRSRGS